MTIRLTDAFKPNIENCRDITSAGSVIYFSPLLPCDLEPVQSILKIVAPIPADPAGTNSIGSKFIRMNIDSVSSGPLGTASVNLFKGTLLTFSNGQVVQITDEIKTVGSGTNSNLVSVQPIGATLATGLATTPIWSVGSLQNTTDMSFGFNDTVSDNSDLISSFQSANIVTASELKTQVQFRLACDDITYHNYILPAYRGRSALYCSYWQGAPAGCGHWAFGRVYIANLNFSAANKDYIKGSFDLLWQPNYAYGTKRSELNAAQKASFDDLCLYTGLTQKAANVIVPVRL
jgi:hypothetical protein